jgi:hypothetical protein
MNGPTPPKLSKLKLLTLALALRKNKTMDNQLASIIGGIVRHAITVVSGAFVANGLVTGSQVETASGAITALIIIGWSIWQKKKAAKAS